MISKILIVTAYLLIFGASLSLPHHLEQKGFKESIRNKQTVENKDQIYHLLE